MIFIIRHGQTEMNQANIMQGHSNYALNENGKEQARQVGRWFEQQGIRFDRVYSSPLIRAVQTALLVSGTDEKVMEQLIQAVPVPGAEHCEYRTEEGLSDLLQTDERLIEMDYGPYEGACLTNLPPELLAFFSDFQNNPAPEGMEPLDQVVGRTGEFLEEIREAAAAQNILIATHAIAMKGFLEYLTPESKGSYWSKYVGNCAVYTAEIQDGRFSVPEELKIDQSSRQN